MNKAELIKLLKERIGEKYTQPVVKKAIPEIVNECFSIIKEKLSKGEDIRIRNFGTFKTKEIKKEEEVKKIVRFIPAKK